jgi:hypothetical protein
MTPALLVCTRKCSIVSRRHVDGCCLLFPGFDLGGNMQKADWSATVERKQCGREVGRRSSQSCPRRCSRLNCQEWSVRLPVPHLMSSHGLPTKATWNCHVFLHSTIISYGGFSSFGDIVTANSAVLARAFAISMLKTDISSEMEREYAHSDGGDIGTSSTGC